MLLDGSLGLLKGRGSSSRDAIVRVLAYRWPLTAKALHNSLVKESTQPISYQAVHKSLRELVEAGVVEKRGRCYEIQKTWIDRLKACSHDLAERYEKGTSLPNDAIDFARGIKRKFNDYNQMLLWLATTLNQGALSDAGPSLLVGLVRHLGFPLHFKFSDYQLLHRTINRFKLKSLGVVQCNTPFDQWIARHYEQAGGRGPYLGAPVQLENDYYVAGDYVITLKYAPETMAFLDKVYEDVDGLTKLLYLEFTQKISQRAVDVDVEIVKNADLARLLRNQVFDVIEKGCPRLAKEARELREKTNAWKASKKSGATPLRETPPRGAWKPVKGPAPGHPPGHEMALA